MVPYSNYALSSIGYICIIIYIMDLNGKLLYTKSTLESLEVKSLWRHFQSHKVVLPFFLIPRTSNIIVYSDRSGKPSPVNKTTEETISRITKFLNDIYQNSQATIHPTYFHPTLSWKKIFEQYCFDNPNHYVNFYIFKREIEKCSVKIYLLKKDTCSQSGQNNAKLSGELTKERMNVVVYSEIHKSSESKSRLFLFLKVHTPITSYTPSFSEYVQ